MPLRPRYVVRGDNLNIIDKMVFKLCDRADVCIYVYTVMVCDGQTYTSARKLCFACISVYYHRDALLLLYEYVR